MSEQIEARRLSGADIGQMVEGITVWPAEITTVTNPDPDFLPDGVCLGLRCPWLPRSRQHVSTILRGSDLVTVTGRGQS